MRNSSAARDAEPLTMSARYISSWRKFMSAVPDHSLYKSDL
jgi:hypothetical protein